jgi:hypothetical protein
MTNWKLTSLQGRLRVGAKPPEKARYLLSLFAGSMAGQDLSRQKLIAAVLDDFKRLGHE